MRLVSSILTAVVLPVFLLGASARKVAAQTAMPAANTAPAQPAAIQQFQHLEDSWSVALVNKDQYALENLLAPTFLDISAEAAVNTRNQLIADALAGLPKPLLSVEQKVVNVRVVSDVAIVEGTYMLKLRESGRTQDQRGIFTHVYQRSRNNWNCVSAQQTAVVNQLEGGKGRGASAAAPGSASESAPASATGNTASKKSNAALPFHIPLLYKGAASKTAQQAPPPAAVSNPPQ